MWTIDWQLVFEDTADTHTQTQKHTRIQRHSHTHTGTRPNSKLKSMSRFLVANGNHRAINVFDEFPKGNGIHSQNGYRIRMRQMAIQIRQPSTEFDSNEPVWFEFRWEFGIQERIGSSVWTKFVGWINFIADTDTSATLRSFQNRANLKEPIRVHSSNRQIEYPYWWQVITVQFAARSFIRIGSFRNRLWRRSVFWSNQMHCARKLSKFGENGRIEFLNSVGRVVLWSLRPKTTRRRQRILI